MNRRSSGFVPPEDKIDDLIRKKEESNKVYVPKSEGLQKIYDNIRFTQEVKSNPLLLKKDYKGFVSGTNNFKVVSLSNFLNLRLYPRSIYTTDKLLRLAVSGRYEQLKKHLQKKRAVPFNMLWILLIVFGVIIVIIVILFLLPKLGVM